MSPADSLRLLEQYGVVILPALTVAEQVGVPLPALPALLAVGALAAHGRASIPLVLGAIAGVARGVALSWYELGRRGGGGVIVRMGRFSLQQTPGCAAGASSPAMVPGPCSLRSLSGLTTVMPPLAVSRDPAREIRPLRSRRHPALGGHLIKPGYVFSDASGSAPPAPPDCGARSVSSSLRRSPPTSLSSICAAGCSCGRCGWLASLRKL
jgi:hypothetical protein